jgi:hypothetical protein
MGFENALGWGLTKRIEFLTLHYFLQRYHKQNNASFNFSNKGNNSSGLRMYYIPSAFINVYTGEGAEFVY